MDKMIFEELKKISGKNILITGATGLIGSAFTDLLMTYENLDFNIYASGRNIKYAEKLFSKYKKSPYFHFISFDVTKNIDSDIYFDFIVDSAGGSSPGLYLKSPVEVMESNILGVKNLLDYGIHHGLKKFVYVSSDEIYGEGDIPTFNEYYSGYVNPLSVRSCYPIAKRAAETLCISYAKEYGVEISIARPCHVYGPNFTESDDRVYAQMIRNILNHEDVILKSKGMQFRSWVYSDDCALALLFIMLKGNNCDAYNIANEKSTLSIREFAEIIARQSNKKVVFDIKSDDFYGNTTPIKNAVLSTDKLKSLGWSAQVGIEEGIKRTIEIRMKRDSIE